MALVTVGVTCRPPFPSSCWPAPPSASMMASLSRTGRQPFSPPPLGGAFLNDVWGQRALLCITRRSSGSGTRPDSVPVLLFSRGADSLSVLPACPIEHIWQLLPHPYRRSSLSCCVDGKWVANPARTSLLDLGYSGGATFDVQISSPQGCRGGADAALHAPALWLGGSVSRGLVTQRSPRWRLQSWHCQLHQRHHLERGGGHQPKPRHLLPSARRILWVPPFHRITPSVSSASRLR